MVDHPAEGGLLRNSSDRAPLAFDESKRRMEEAARWTPGGINSHFRAGISPTPLVIERGDGPYLIDADGNRLIDYYLGMGPMILGHSPKAVKEAVAAQLERGLLYAGQSEIEIEAARLVCQMVPCAERLRFASSGTEAVQAAIRLARAATGRKIVLKFEGHYHGWADNILLSTAPPLAEAGPREAPNAILGSRGQDPDAAHNTVVLPWNDLGLVERRLAQGDVALVIMEAAMCNSGCIHPLPGYLEGVRAACTRHGTLLLFDEVITGFRLAPGGAQQRFGVTPDLATFAKAIASGFPVAALAGRAGILDLFVKGGVLQGGTYNAQPVAMAATVATMKTLADPAVYAGMERRGTRLMEGLREAFRAAKVPAMVTGFPQIFHVALDMTEPARDYRDLARANKKRYVAFTTALLRRGVRALERGAWFLSTAHDDEVVEATIAAAAEAAREI
ncbi:MAG: glutamate-1-semialdehyde 2,1-aminomutase [Alphaproteobacteria bacterium]|nr:glutamate-1-semialdehyde 2,1-aminomutase [Alphaproteobacteria bacterium]